MGPTRQLREEGYVAKDEVAAAGLMDILEGIGAGRFGGHKLGHTDGSNRGAGMVANRLATTQQF
jgi:hypothetical protein